MSSVICGEGYSSYNSLTTTWVDLRASLIVGANGFDLVGSGRSLLQNKEYACLFNTIFVDGQYYLVKTNYTIDHVKPINSFVYRILRFSLTDTYLSMDIWGVRASDRSREFQDIHDLDGYLWFSRLKDPKTISTCI